MSLGIRKDPSCPLMTKTNGVFWGRETLSELGGPVESFVFRESDMTETTGLGYDFIDEKFSPETTKSNRSIAKTIRRAASGLSKAISNLV